MKSTLMGCDQAQTRPSDSVELQVSSVVARALVLRLRALSMKPLPILALATFEGQLAGKSLSRNFEQMNASMGLEELA